jgi:putative ABC transport system permease protein
MQFRQSVPDVEDIVARAKSFEAIGGATVMPLDYTGGSEPVQLQTAIMTAGLLKVLGVKPFLGRFFTEAEDRLYGDRLVVLQHSFWQEHMGADRNAIGKMIVLSGVGYRVIGVLPPGFKIPLEDVDLLTLVRVVQPEAAAERGVHFLRTFCLLKPEIPMERAQAEMKTIDRQLEKIDPSQNKNRQTVLIPFHERVTGEARPAIIVLFAAVTLVLLIACSNYANLLLARGAERQQEMLIRNSLGAGRWRLVRQMVTEGMIVALVGGACGLLLAFWAVDLLQTLEPGNLPRIAEISMDTRVLLFTLAVSVAVGLLSAIVPAWTSSGSDPGVALKESSRTATPGSVRHRFRTVLVIGELALAVLLLIGAGLLIQTFHELRSVHPGFTPDKILTTRIDLPEARYETTAVQEIFRSSLLDSLNSRAEIHAALISELPFSGDYLDHNFIIVGRPPLEPGTEPSIYNRSIQGSYFRVMQIPMIQGREFSKADHIGSPNVGVVNQATVQKYFPDGNPLGSQIRWAADEDSPPITIVGVVGDVKHFGANVSEEPAIYTPYAQTNYWKRWMTLVVRTEIPTTDVVQIVKNEIWKLDPHLPVTRMETMPHLMANSLKRQEFNMLLLGIFGAIALGLASIGLFGVISYSVAQRSHEIGIRMALGAERNHVIRMIVKEGVFMTLIGVIIGLATAFAATRLMASLLFGVSTKDPVTFLIVAMLLSAVALLASLIPAIRATKVDPMHALRHD